MLSRRGWLEANGLSLGTGFNMSEYQENLQNLEALPVFVQISTGKETQSADTLP
jgi:hypothetical protein